MISEARRVLEILPPRLRRLLLALAVLMLLGAVAEVISLGAIVPFLSVLVDPQGAASLPVMGGWLATKPLLEQRLWVGGGFLLALSTATAMRIVLLSANIRFSHAAGYALSRAAFAKTLSQPYDWHTQHNSSEHIANLERVNAFVGRNIGPMLNLLTALILGGGILALLFVTQTAIMVGLMIGISGFYFLVVRSTRRNLLRNGQVINRAARERVRVLQESLGGIRDVILDNSYNVHQKRFEREEMAARAAMRQNEWISQLPRYLLEFIGMAAIVAMATTVAAIREDDALSTLGLIAFGSQKLLPLAQQIYYAWGTMKTAGPARADVLRLMALPGKKDQDRNVDLAAPRSLRLADVNYSYPGHRNHVLKGINLNLQLGERIGFVGPSGGGKSTLIDLIMGLLTPSDGKMSVDSTVLTAQNMAQWRKRIAHVPQSIYLLDASVRENIAFGIVPDEIDETRILNCIRMAQLTDTVAALPAGLDSIIGERGVLLSGGQRQRIGIARALYRNADILVLDEATSALDNDTEQRIISALQEIGPDVTILMVAHRLSTLAQCDRIIHIEMGRITREESYSELMHGSKCQDEPAPVR